MSRVIKFRAWNAEEGMLSINQRSAELWPVLLFEDPGAWEVMQFTGLLDKNGKEIYEGDIYFDSYLNRNVTVDELTVAYWLIDEDKMNIPMQYISVIGNVWETPELLKSK